MERLEDYISESEISQTRNPEEFITWFDDKLEITKKTGLKRQCLLHEGIAKEFYEELFPLYRLLQHKRNKWCSARFAPVLGSQNFDVKIEGNICNVPQYIEITQADQDYNSYLRMRSYLECANVSMVGKVTYCGTKKRGLNISVSDDWADRLELKLTKKEQLKEAIRKKETVAKRFDCTALLLYFDDWSSYLFFDYPENEEMREFIDSLSLDKLWANGYTGLFIVGASGKGFWEKYKEFD